MGLVKQMHVDLRGSVGAAVAQSLADTKERDVAAVGDTGEAVAQTVQSHIGQLCPGQHPLQPVAQIVRLVGLAAVVADDKALVVVGIPQLCDLQLPLPPEALHQLLHVRQAPVSQAADRGAVFRALVHRPPIDRRAGLHDGDDPVLQVHMAPLQAADLAAPQAHVPGQLHHGLQACPGQNLKELGHGLAVIVVVDGAAGGGRVHLLRHVAGHQLLTAGVLQGVVQHAVVLADGVVAQALRLLAVEVLLHLGGGELRQADAAQGR